MVRLKVCSTRTGGVRLFTCVFRVLLSERLRRYPESPESHGYWSRAFGDGSLTTSQYKPS